MKNIYLSIFTIVLLLTSCQKNSDITETINGSPSSELISTIDFEWWVIVEEEESLYTWGDLYGNSIHNASVKLMFMGEVLWESNTDDSGRINFPEQPVPAEGAYFQFEAPGYYPLIVQVETESIPLWRVNMVRNTFPNINGEAILNAEKYITLTGQLQEPFTARESWYYITNSNNEIIGNALSGPEVPSFYMTTLPNEELFLHYNVECGEDDVISLGSFSESTDIGILLDQSFDFSHGYDLVSLNNVTECSTGIKLYGYELFYKEENLTFQAGGNSGFNIRDCQPAAYPILLSVATQNPRKYVEVTIMHTPGTQSNVPDQEVCEDDDTFLEYLIGNNMPGGAQVFTYADIQDDGQMVIKQTQNSLTKENRFSMVLSGSTPGSHQCNVNIIVREEFATGGWTNINGLGGHAINATITMNDGEFVEGTFSGEVLDTGEVSLGIMEGTFRARIQ